MNTRPFATDPAPDWRSRPLDWCLWYLDEYAMEWAEALNGLKAAAAKARGAS